MNTVGHTIAFRDAAAAGKGHLAPAAASLSTSSRGEGRRAKPALAAAVLLGGEANALSVARDLASLGVSVYALGEPDSTVRHSRHVRWLDVPVGAGGQAAAWSQFLLGPDAEFLRGAVVLACSDAGLQVLIRHRDELLGRYKLDESNPAAQLAMLDKLTTYKRAAAAGVTTPGFWEVSTRAQIEALRDALVFPLMVKPRMSHLFEAKFGGKHVIVDSFDALLSTFDLAAGAGMDVLLMEWIPGGDDRLCSYYTYLDAAGTPLLHFTKRIIRRYPAGMGTACYHVTDRIPELEAIANQLFRHVGLRGLANVEFKQDPRDGRYKLIECNARFTASNCLVSAAGVNLAAFVYNRLTGHDAPAPQTFRSGLRLWDPVRDFWSYRELSQTGELTLARWLASICRPQTFPYFRWTDPMPALARITKPLRRRLGGGGR